MKRGDETYDLLAELQTFSLGSEEAVTITVTPNWRGQKPGKIPLLQDAVRRLESAEGVFQDVQPGKVFNCGGNIFLMLIDAAGKTVECSELRMSVVSPQASLGLSSGPVNLLENCSFEVPEGVPILEHSRFGLGLGSIAEVEIKGSTFKVALGIDTKQWERDTLGHWKDTDWKWFTAGCKEAKEKINTASYSQLKNILNSHGSVLSEKLTMSSALAPSVMVCGYLEGRFDSEGKPLLTEGGMIIVGKVKYTYQGLVIVSIVPLYYEVGAGGGLTLVNSADTALSEEGIAKSFTGTVTPSVFLEAGGGLGVPQALTAGIMGKVQAAFQYALQRDYQKFDVTGSARFQLKGPFNVLLYEKEFLQSTWLVYETGNPDTLLGREFGMYAQEKGIYEAIDLDAPIRFAKSGDKDSQSEWAGGRSSRRLFADYSHKTVKTLATGVSPDTAPAVSRMGDKTVMVWITENKERKEANRAMLVYSVYDETADTWSEPKAVCDDGKADYYPALCDGYVAWQKAKITFDKDTTLRQLAAGSEIYAAKWEGTGFGEAIAVTDNDTMDALPKITRDGEGAIVAWLTNSKDSFLGTEGANTIMKATVTAGGAAKTTEEATGLNAVTGLAAGSVKGSPQIAYVVDNDNDLETITDRQLYAGGKAVNGQETQISNPTYAQYGGKSLLFWHEQGNIHYQDSQGTAGQVFGADDPGIGDNFTVISNDNDRMAVLWTAVEDGGAEIHAALYNGESWSKDVKLSELGEKAKNPNGILQDNGDLLIVFNRTKKLPDGSGYYIEGEADLCTLLVTHSYDVAVTELYCNEKELAPGAPLEIQALVKNLGELEAKSITLTVLNADGSKNGSFQIDKPLKPGEEREATVIYQAPANIVKGEISVRAAIGEGEEHNTENNTASILLGRVDISVDDAHNYRSASVDEIAATVKNAGYDTAQNITVSLRQGSAEGEVLASREIAAQAPQTEQEVRFDISGLTFGAEEKEKVLYVTAASDADDSPGNNDDYEIVSARSIEENFAVTIAAAEFIEEALNVNVIVKSNIDETQEAVFMTAVYDKTGRLKSVKDQTASIEQRSTSALDLSVAVDGIAAGDKVKCFLLDGLHSLKPLCAAAEYKVP
jgi:hypothetical protein